MAHRGETQQHTSRSADTYCVSKPTRHRGFVARSCPEANYKWSPQARHDDETRTTCVRAMSELFRLGAPHTQAKHHKTKQPKPRNKCFQPNDKRTHVWLSQPSTTLCLLRTACVLLLLRVFRWAPMQGSRSRGASSERRTQPPARGPRLCGGGLVSRCSPFVATFPPFFSDVRVLFKKVTTRLLATYSLTPVCLLFLTPLVEIPHIKTIAVSRERIEVAPASTRCPERAAWP